MSRMEVGEPYYRIDLEEALEMYQREETVVIDVRRPDEYVAGHVANALSIPVDDILSRFDELSDSKKLLFICEVGVRSGLACEMAAAMGLSSDNLYNIEAGTGSWINAGHPSSKGAK
jgi:rhodanese-related sulfurtransferase